MNVFANGSTSSKNAKRKKKEKEKELDWKKLLELS